MSKQPRKLPLDDDPRWWRLAETLQHCRTHPLFRLEDLADVVRQGAVGCKFEWRGPQPAPPQAKLLTAEFFRDTADIVPYFNTLSLKPRIANLRPLSHVLYLWEPDIKNFWPERVAAPTPNDSMQPPTRRRGPPVTDDWFTICGEIARRCIKSGRVRVPKNQTELVEAILQWCRDEHDREPAKSSVHEAVRRVCAALAKAEK